MKLTHLLIMATLGVTLFIMSGCGDNYAYSPYRSYPIVPANYATFYHETDTATDYVIFTGAYNPAGTQNGTGTNTLYARTFTPSVTAAASTLVGSTWVGRMGDLTAPQLTLTVVSTTRLDVKLDCYFAGTNILVGNAAVSLPIVLNANTAAFTQVFRIVNTSTTDINTFCAFTLNSDSITFSTDTGTATVSTSGGTVLGSFTRQ